jgi:hypothetical protein
VNVLLTAHVTVSAWAEPIPTISATTELVVSNAPRNSTVRMVDTPTPPRDFP